MTPLIQSLLVAIAMISGVVGAALVFPMENRVESFLSFPLSAAFFVVLLLHGVFTWVRKGSYVTYLHEAHIAVILLASFSLSQFKGGIFQGYNFLLVMFGIVLVSSSTSLVPFVKVLAYFSVSVIGVYLNDHLPWSPYLSQINWRGALEVWEELALALGVGGMLVLAQEQRRRHLANTANQLEPQSPQPEEVLPLNVNEWSSGHSVFPMEQREFVSPEKLKDVLDSVLFFVARNFKANNALGFLTKKETSDRLELVAYRSRASEIQRNEVRAGVGVIGRALRKKEAFVSGDLRNYPVKLEYAPENTEINSIMVVPITDEGGMDFKGMLVVDSEGYQAFTDEDKELLSRFSKIAFAMISNILLSERVQSQAKRMDTLYQSAQRLSQVQKVEEVFKILSEELAEVFPDLNNLICLLQSGKGKIWKGGGDANLKVTEFDPNKKGSLYGYVLRKGVKVLVRDLSQKKEYFRFDQKEEGAPHEILILPLKSDRGKVIGAVGLESSGESISDHHVQMFSALLANFSTALDKARSYAELEKMATIDGLTQIPNHRKFQEVMDAEISRVERYGESVTLLLMDIDHFKKFNDTYGHPVGDAVLRLVAKTLKGQIRKTDFCARYGGEEFVVVLIESDMEASAMLTERIRAAIEAAKLEHNGETLNITVSIGSATFPQDAGSKQELIDNADKAMYQSKESGRNRITSFEALKAIPN